MKQAGIIIDVQGNKAVVQIKRATACGEKCGQCSGCETTINKVEAINPINAKIGQTVIMELPDANVLFAAFIMYIVPIILLFGGIGIGYIVLKNIAFAIIIGVIVMILSFFVIKKMDGAFLKSEKFKPIITKIIQF